MTLESAIDFADKSSEITSYQNELMEIDLRSYQINTRLVQLWTEEMSAIRRCDRAMKSDLRDIYSGRSGEAEGVEMLRRNIDTDEHCIANEEEAAKLCDEDLGLHERMIVLEEKIIACYDELIEAYPGKIEKERKGLEKKIAEKEKYKGEVKEKKAELKEAKKNGDAERIAAAEKLLHMTEHCLGNYPSCIKSHKIVLKNTQDSFEYCIKDREYYVKRRDRDIARLEHDREKRGDIDRYIATDKACAERTGKVIAEVTANPGDEGRPPVKTGRWKIWRRH